MVVDYENHDPRRCKAASFSRFDGHKQCGRKPKVEGYCTQHWVKVEAQLREEHKCVACGRPTVDTEEKNNPLRRCWQVGGATSYILCRRCEDVAETEHKQSRAG